MRRWTISGSAMVLVAGLVALSPGRVSQAQHSPLFGALTPGRYAVGFRKRELLDPTRAELSAPDSTGRATIASRTRKLVVHLWYPATPNAASRLTFRDYLFSHFADTVSAATRQAFEAEARRFINELGPVTDEQWARLLNTPLLARRNAGAAAGRFPLVVGSLRSLSTTITNEYLASHGYVVAMVDGDQPNITDAGRGLEVSVRDMEFIVPELRKLPFVDPARLAALGFSGSGFSQVLFAMRHPELDAVSDLESALFDEHVMWPLSRGWGYDVAALRVPFLHMYSVPLSRLENRIADFESMRYATRYRFLVDAPGIHHWDFATEGRASTTVLGTRGSQAERLRAMFETTNRTLLAFFNAYVKRDSGELAYLRRDPAANGAPPGLATIRELPAIVPAPSAEAFEVMIGERGFDAAMTVFEQARRRDPGAEMFEERPLNRTAYHLLRAGKKRDATALFRTILDLYPNSVNAHDSMAEALEMAGDSVRAMELTRKAIDLLETQDMSATAREQIRRVLDARLQRLAPRPS